MSFRHVLVQGISKEVLLQGLSEVSWVSNVGLGPSPGLYRVSSCIFWAVSIFADGRRTIVLLVIGCMRQYACNEMTLINLLCTKRL